MDPNTNLKAQARIIARKLAGDTLHNYDRYELYELRVALKDWLKGGGFAPNWAAHPDATAAFRKWAGAYTQVRTSTGT